MGAACGCGSAPVEPSDDFPLPSPVTLTEYNATFANETSGAVSSLEVLKARIHEGGIEEDLRSTLWLRLFGIIGWADPNPQAAMEDKRLEYDALRMQWEENDADLDNCSLKPVRDHYRVIQNDVDRTDRGGPIFHEDGALQALRRVLLTFCCSEGGAEVGYFQGMNDMVAVIFSVFPWFLSVLWLTTHEP